MAATRDAENKSSDATVARFPDAGTDQVVSTLGVQLTEYSQRSGVEPIGTDLAFDGVHLPTRQRGAFPRPHEHDLSNRVVQPRKYIYHLGAHLLSTFSLRQPEGNGLCGKLQGEPQGNYAGFASSSPQLLAPAQQCHQLFIISPKHSRPLGMTAP